LDIQLSDRIINFSDYSTGYLERDFQKKKKNGSLIKDFNKKSFTIILKEGSQREPILKAFFENFFNE